MEERLAEPLLECRRLGRRDPRGDRWLVREISLQVLSGDRLALLGPSGAGKSVLLRLMALLDDPDEGEVCWRGSTVLPREVPSYRRQVMYVSQRPHLVEGTVRENLEVPFRLRIHRDRSFSYPETVSRLERLRRSADFLQLAAADLSGGEAQLVALLRTLQLGPQVLLLDEPTASADAATARMIETLVDEWARADCDRALVCVTHQLDQAERWTRRQLSLVDGRLERETRVGWEASQA